MRGCALRPGAVLLLASLCGGCPDRERVVVLFVVADVRGTVAPCGCTTDPLGGLDRAAALVRSEKRPHALLAAGPLGRDPEDHSAARRLEADEKAALLERTFAALSGLGPGVHEVGGVRLGIVAVPAGATEPPPRPPAVDLAIALGEAPPGETRRLLRAGAFDLVVPGRKVERGQPVPEPVGQGWLFVPADQLQGVWRIEIHLRPPREGGGGPLVWAGGPGEIERLDRRIDTLARELAGWRSAPDADPGFVAAREQELGELRADRARRTSHGQGQGQGVRVQPPARGSWITGALVEIRQKLPSDAAVLAAMRAMDRKIGQENRRRDCAAPPPAQKREPHYVGMASCGEGGCHPQAVALWKGTVHAQAWKSLVDDGRAFSLDCFGCHVTGAGEPDRGGATLCRPEPLTDVGCEVCHGPASAHVAAGGIEDAPSLRKRPPEALCAERCHTPEHSDTFQAEAYLRDILGEGHGAARRKALGRGPTGHELRQAGLRRAGRAP